MAEGKKAQSAAKKPTAEPQKRKPGAPAKMDDGRRRNVYMADSDHDYAAELGGNASAGIRRALQIAREVLSRG